VEKNLIAKDRGAVQDGEGHLGMLQLMMEMLRMSHGDVYGCGDDSDDGSDLGDDGKCGDSIDDNDGDDADNGVVDGVGDDADEGVDDFVIVMKMVTLVIDHIPLIPYTYGIYE
jgi:hypothetical protein